MNYSRKDEGEGLKLIKTAHIFTEGPMLDFETLARVNLMHKSGIENYFVREGDLFFVRSYGTRTGVGYVCMAPMSDDETVHGGFIIRFRINSQKAVPLYLTYLLRSEDYRKIITTSSGGSNINNVNQELLGQLKVNLPPYEEQEAISQTLWKFDHLIENNRHRIQLLEEMTRALYREWFVHFRFPGHEDIEMVDSELGKIPEGWQVKKIDDAFEILGGGTPSTKIEEYWEEGNINWYTPSDLTKAGTMFIDESRRKITEVGLKKSSAKIFPEQSVMMTSRATLGVVSINTTPACTNQGFITCIPNDHISMYQILFWIMNNIDLIISLGTGTTYKEIAKSVFREMKFVVPPKEFKDDFESVVSPMGELILNLQRTISVLSESRDLLLPRLVSGKIDVSELEIEIPADTHETHTSSNQSTLDQWLDEDNEEK